MLPPPMAIDWRGPDECQEAPRLSSEVARLVGGGTATRTSSRA